MPVVQILSATSATGIWTVVHDFERTFTVNFKEKKMNAKSECGHPCALYKVFSDLEICTMHKVSQSVCNAISCHSWALQLRGQVIRFFPFRMKSPAFILG